MCGQKEEKERKKEIEYKEEIQEYETEPKNEYQKMMRKNSKSVRNHIGSIKIKKTKKMISLVILFTVNTHQQLSPHRPPI